MLPTLQFHDNPKGRAYGASLIGLLKESPIPEGDLAASLGLYLSGYNLRRLMFLNDLYRQILDVPGYVFDFGTRYGHNLMTFRQLWSMYEPSNITRAFFGFDTFQGLSRPVPEDGEAACASEGHYAVPADYATHLRQLIALNESHDSGGERTFLIEGDASSTLPQLLEENPQTIVSLAYFDFDLYEPTKNCLNHLLPRLTRGSIVAFDELIVREFPGETTALIEAVGLGKVRLKRSPHSHCWSYFVVE